MKDRSVSVQRTATVSLMLLGGLLCASFGLSQSQQSTTADVSSSTEQEEPSTRVGTHALSDSMRYELFFRFLAALDNLAAKFEAEGNKKAAAGWLTHAQRAAGINDQEGAILKQVAYDCNQSVADNRAQSKAAIATFRAQYPNGAYRKVPRPAEITQLKAERQQIVDSHIGRLKSELNEDSLQKLDSYIKSVFKSAVTTRLSRNPSTQQAKGSTALVAPPRGYPMTKLASLSALALLVLEIAPIALSQDLSSSVTSSAATPQIDGGQVYLSCTTSMDDTDTEDDYVQVEADCTWHYAGQSYTEKCLGTPTTANGACDNATFPVIRGGEYYTIGAHFIYLPHDEADCNDDPQASWFDELGYGNPYQQCSSNQTENFCTTYPSGNPQCYGSTLPDAATIGLAPSSSDIVTALLVTASTAEVHPGEAVDFSTNGIGVNWTISPSGIGTLSQANNSTSTIYTAPASIPSQTTVQIIASVPNSGDVESTTITLLPGAITINPSFITSMNQGQTQTFSATVPGCSANCVTWSADLGSFNGAVYTAPSPINGSETDTITATSATDSTQKPQVQVNLYPVSITVCAQNCTNSNILAVGSTPLLVTFSNGGVSSQTCAFMPLPAGLGTLSNTSCMAGTYTAPQGGITVPITVTVTFCDQATVPAVCNSPLSLGLVPPVVISQGTTTNWPAGTTTQAIINGSGFGNTPFVQVAGSQFAFIVTSQSNTQIIGTVTPPSQTPGEALTVSVTNLTSGLAPPPQGSFVANVLPATLGVALAQSSPPQSLEETQSFQFTATVTCKTATGNPCTTGTPSPVFSLNPGNVGSINPNTGLYQAPSTGLTTQTTASGKVCAGTTTNCTNFSVTLVPIIVTVTPATATLLAGKTQTLAAQIQNATAATVNWANPSLGSITASGNTAVYTAPNLIPTAQTVTVRACSTVDNSRCGSAALTLQPADFSIAVTPNIQTVTVGGSTTYAVTVSTTSGFTGAVNLGVTGIPSGASFSFSLNPIPNGSGTSTLTVYSNKALSGTSQLIVTGTSGTLIHKASPATLAITDFSISASPSSQTGYVGTMSTNTVSVSPLNGFTGSVAFSMTGLPTGVTSTFSPSTIASGSGSSTLTITVPLVWNLPGTYSLTITGSSGNISHTLTLPLVIAVNGFTVSSNAPWFVNQGGATTTGMVTITPMNGFDQTVSLSMANLPPGTTYSFNPATINGGSGSSTVTITTSASTPSGIYYPQVQASASAGNILWGPFPQLTLSLQVYAALINVAWVQPSSDAGIGPPNTLTVQGGAYRGTGTVQLLWEDTTLATGWQTVAYQAIPDQYGNWANTIPSPHYCHTFQVEAKFVGLTSPIFTYTGPVKHGAYVYCGLSITWIQPQSGATYAGPPGSLVAAGVAYGAPAGTLVVMWYRDVTAGGSWINGGGVPANGSNVWINNIPNASYSHQYAMYLSYDGINSMNDVCTYLGTSQIIWCP